MSHCTTFIIELWSAHARQLPTAAPFEVLGAQMARCLTQMASPSEREVKIIVELHEGEKSTKKIWRFDQQKTYSKEAISTEVKKLFPHLSKKGLDVQLHHYDALAGKVCIECDGDVEEALKNYVEEWQQGGLRKEYMTLHVVDCMPVKKVIETTEEEPVKKSESRKVCLAIFIVS